MEIQRDVISGFNWVFQPVTINQNENKVELNGELIVYDYQNGTETKIKTTMFVWIENQTKIEKVSDLIEVEIEDWFFDDNNIRYNPNYDIIII